jgi:hypothetical protein
MPVQDRTLREPATCRHCRRTLRGDAFMYGGRAFILETGEEAKVNHYGGFVCSFTCDQRASLALERSMPGHDAGQTRLGSYAQAALKRNWPEIAT